MVPRSICELSKATFIPMYCAIVWPHLGYAMEANAPILRTDIYQLKRVQRLAMRLLRGRRHVPNEERFCQPNFCSLERRRLWNDLILAFTIFNRVVDLYSPSDFFLRPPRAGLRGLTYRYLHGPSRFRRRSGAFSVRVVKYWKRLATHLVLSPLVPIFGPSRIRNLSCNTCVNFVPLHRHFSLYCNPILFMFPCPPNTEQFMLLLLALVTNPTINQ